MTPTINYPQLSIVISTYNRCNTLKRCLDSIAIQDYPKNLLELIVLDDASSDSTAEEIPGYLRHLERQGFLRVLFLRNQENLGIVASRWLLGQKVSPDSETILFVDDDIYLESICLKNLVEYLLEHPEAGVVGPRIVSAKNPSEIMYNAKFVGRWTARYWSKDSGEPIVCDWVYNTCCLIRKKVWEKTGGLWPGYYTCHEEIDLCLRAQKAGFKVVYCPQATAQHELDFGQIKRERRRRLYYIYRNKLLVIRRNFPFFRKIVALSLVPFYGLPKYLLESIKFHKKFLFSELGLIFLSVWHGFLGREGRWGK